MEPTQSECHPMELSPLSEFVCAEGSTDVQTRLNGGSWLDELSRDDKSEGMNEEGLIQG